MSFSDVIGSIGVTLMLGAYFLTLFKFMRQESALYGILNLVGAGLACYASLMIHYIPFVILEGTWGLMAFVGLVRNFSVKAKE